MLSAGAGPEDAGSGSGPHPVGAPQPEGRPVFAGAPSFIATLRAGAGRDRPRCPAAYTAAAGLVGTLCPWRLPETAPGRTKGATVRA
ncbi:hypothetical protein AB0P02_25075 [Streptomyces griseoluteus]|uniref:hypothetical protein n=1 Tax=Streptomyces griseoluteus TaxID=29306 RepID=UPI0034382979